MFPVGGRGGPEAGGGRVLWDAGPGGEWEVLRGD